MLTFTPPCRDSPPPQLLIHPHIPSSIPITNPHTHTFPYSLIRTLTFTYPSLHSFIYLHLSQSLIPIITHPTFPYLSPVISHRLHGHSSRATLSHSRSSRATLSHSHSSVHISFYLSFSLSVENSPLNLLQYPAGSESLGRAVSLASLAASATMSTRSNPDSLKRMSSSEDRAFPAFSANSSSRMKSRSYHNLGELPESPEHRGAPFSSAHQRASSDTDSIAVHGQQEG